MANRMVRWFTNPNLPPHLQAIVTPLREVAEAMDVQLPEGPEKTAGLRKLLEAKDCLVRAAIEAAEAAAGSATTALLLCALLLGTATIAGAQTCEPGMKHKAGCTDAQLLPRDAQVTTQTCPCQPGLEPRRTAGGCRCVGAWPSTTVPGSSSTTTSTTRPTPTTAPGGGSTTSSTTSTTSTTLRPVVRLTSYDPTYGDVGMHWTAQSQEMMFNHQTGLPLNQADAWGLLLYLRFVFEPELIAAADSVPSCARAIPGMLEAMATTTDKFLADYVLRPVLSGGTYAVHGNYHWDLTHTKYLRPFQGCLLADAIGNAAWLAARPEWQQALDLRVDATAVVGGDVVGMRRIVRGDPTYKIPLPCADSMGSDGTYSCARSQTGNLPEADALGDRRAGAVAARYPDPPLTSVQCAALAKFGEAHDSSTGVLEAQRAFEATATTPRQQTLFHMPFTTQRNPKRFVTDDGRATAARLEAAKHAGFAVWRAGFHCQDGKPPNLPEIVAGLLQHVGPHNLLALPPGAKLRSICPATLKRSGRSAVVSCPWVQS